MFVRALLAATLSQRDWDRFIRARRAGGVGPSGKPVSDRTVEYDLRLVIAIFTWAGKSRDERGRLLLDAKTPNENTCEPSGAWGPARDTIQYQSVPVAASSPRVDKGEPHPDSVVRSRGEDQAGPAVCFQGADEHQEWVGGRWASSATSGSVSLASMPWSSCSAGGTANWLIQVTTSFRLVSERWMARATS